MIYAIIVTYNAMRRNWIERCLQSLRASTVPVTPIVIDNGSTDGTCEYVPTHHPEVIWMPQQKNLGFGQANNVGIRYVLEHEADYVMLLNQDAAIAPDAVSALLDAAQGQKALFSPLQLNGEGTKVDQMFRKTLHQTDNGLLEDFLVNHEVNPVYSTGIFAAACWFMPFSILKEVGGFNPLFSHYGEDDNYQFRARYHGYENLVVIKARMYHDRGEHGNVEIFNKNRMRRELLLLALDINLTPLQSTKAILYLLYKCYTYRLPRHQYRPGTFLPAAIWTLTHLHTIAASRKKEKSIGPTWL